MSAQLETKGKIMGMSAECLLSNELTKKAIEA